MANSTPFVDPIAVSRDTVQNIGVSAPDMRFALGGLAHPSSGASFGNQSGVFPGGSSGAGAPNDLAVGPAGNMKSRVQPGAYACDRGASGLYLGALTAVADTPAHLASSPSNPRIDYVVVRNRDPGVDTTETVTESAFLVVLDGTPASAPVGPNAKLTNGDVLIGVATVRQNATSIAAGDYSDPRRWVVSRGGITIRVPGDTRPGSYEGQYADNIAFDQLERWSGTAWDAVATPAVWRTYTPRLYAQGSKTDVQIGTNSTRVGRFQLVGKRLDFNLQFKWSSGPWNGGAGDICSYLPVHPVTGDQLYGAGYPQWCAAHLWTNTAAYVGDFPGQTLVVPNSSRLQPYFAKRHGHVNTSQPVDMNTFPYRIASSLAAPNTGIPRIFNPDGFPEGGTLELSGSCEVTW